MDKQVCLQTFIIPLSGKKNNNNKIVHIAREILNTIK